MEGSGNGPSDDNHPAPDPQDDDDWLLKWSRSTRQAPAAQPKPPRTWRMRTPQPTNSDRPKWRERVRNLNSELGSRWRQRVPRFDTEGGSKWRPRAPNFGPLLDWVEARRLEPILDGSAVRMADTPEGPRPALVHRHWIGLVFRLIGAALAVAVACVLSPAFLALLVLAGCHGLLVAARRSIKNYYGVIIGGSEFVAGLLVGGYLGAGVLRVALIIATVCVVAMTVVAWQVDMELVTEGGRLVRTRGLFLLKRTVAAPLTSIRIADITGPIFGLGLVTVDTTSDQDQLLHDFGLIGQPNEWAALLLREAARPKSPVPSSRQPEPEVDSD